MSVDKKQLEKKVNIEVRHHAAAGYQPAELGYQPTQGNLDSSNPPKGGSGVSSTFQGKVKKSQ